MIEVIALDSGPLGLLASPVKSREVVDINLWAESQIRAGRRLVVPAIAAYEVRRELVRAGKAAGIGRLDAFLAAEPDRLLSITDGALILGADLWARARQHGQPTADARELDCDVLIAAQVLLLGPQADQAIVATANVGHLRLFVPSEIWYQIAP